MTDWLADAARYASQWLGYQIRSTEQPGCVLAIAQAGKLMTEAAFGVADLAAGVPMTPRHRFRVASHSKTFTSAGLMLLHEARKLHLDDPIGTHVGDLPPAVAAVTISQLMSHSAGMLRDGTDAGHWQDRHPFFDQAALRAQLRDPLTLAPNTRFKYSNVGYGLLGLAIEAITGESYESWMTRNVVEPSGLSETLPDMPPDLGAPMATGYSARLPAGRRFAIPGHNPTRALASATGFVSTAGDLARFMGALDPDAPGSVLSAASRREMTRRHWRIPHADPERHYGLGTISGTADGHVWFGHSGAFQGFISRTACVPEWGVTVSVLTNAIDGLANQWVEGILGILHRFGLHGAPEPAVADWAGRWWSYWGAIDLVPMGRRVLIAAPALLTPFADASELEIESPTRGRIDLANGFGSHGEPASRELEADGSAARLRLGGTELLPEASLLEEVARRRSLSASVSQP